MRDKIISLTLFLGVFSFYLYQCASSVTAGDSGEFMTAAGTLSLSHAPSYPLYMLLGRCFIEILPFGSIGFRMNIFSAVTSAAAVTMCYVVSRVLSVSFVLSLFLALAFATTSSLWANSLVTEVFSLNALLATLLILIMAGMERSSSDRQSGRYLVQISFLLGFGLGNHHILVFMGAGFLLYVLIAHRTILKPKWVGLAIFFAVLGFSVYISLPVRSAKEPPLNWGKPTSVSKLTRTILRNDYGSLRLSLDKSPSRSIENTRRHLVIFGRQLAKDMSIPLMVLCGFGLFLGIWRRRKITWVFFVLFLLTGPFFYVLGNLPFNAQSEGIMGRFFIFPILFLILFLTSLDRYASFLIPLVLFLNVKSGWAHGIDHRSTRLVYDYGQAMLRSMPPGSILFLDGGDDAFYSLAMLQYVMNKRPDVELHDRGGLVFRNIYGEDFRILTKDDKRLRRAEVERKQLESRPVFYSSMDRDALPGVKLVLNGFLYEAQGAPGQGLRWPLICLRTLYPLRPNDYRTRALAAFFPFMRGKAELERNDFGKTLKYFQRAQVLGHDVDWLRANLGYEYAQWGYDSLVRGRHNLAEWIYTQWLGYDGEHVQAQCNYGVVLERLGKIQEAKTQYKKAASMFPHEADPVFNLAVLSWKEGDWASVVEFLQEVLKRQPNHQQAYGYLQQAKEKMAESTP